jgi:hypothetical protein
MPHTTKHTRIKHTCAYTHHARVRGRGGRVTAIPFVYPVQGLVEFDNNRSSLFMCVCVCVRARALQVLSMLMDKDMFPLSCGGKAELNLHTCCLRTGEMCLERNVQLQGLDMLQGDMEALSLPDVTVVGALSVAASRRGSLIEAMSRRGSMTMKEDKSSDSDEAEKRTSVSPQRDRGAGRWSPCDDEAHRRGDDSDLRDWGRGGRPRPESDFEPAEEWRAAAGRGGVGWAHGDVDVEEQENDETEESTGPGYPLRRLGSNTEDQSRSGVT